MKHVYIADTSQYPVYMLVILFVRIYLRRVFGRRRCCVPCETAIITSGRGERGKWSVAHCVVEGAALGLCPGAWTFFISFFLHSIRRRRHRRRLEFIAIYQYSLQCLQGS